LQVHIRSFLWMCLTSFYSPSFCLSCSFNLYIFFFKLAYINCVRGFIVMAPYMHIITLIIHYSFIIISFPQTPLLQFKWTSLSYFHTFM
jgi:hypothetical protein